MSHQKTILIVLDGVGEYKDYPGNAFSRAEKPFLDGLYKKYPWTLLASSGNAVGVPEGVQGASEPGHVTMGAGRIVYQPFEEINQAIKKGLFGRNKALLECMKFVKKKKSTLHLLGMISDGGVHSHLSHLYELLQLAKKMGLEKVLIHGITDGRDVPEQSAMTYVHAINQKTKELNIGSLATLIGRYYAMDRDNNWDRIKVAYDLLVHGKGEYYSSVAKAFGDFYKQGKKHIGTDYYLPAIKLFNKKGFIEAGDGVIFFNFRSDRARQLSAAFAPDNLKGLQTFQVKDVTVPKISFVCMGPYSDTLPVAFPPQKVVNNLGSWLSQHKLKQLHIAETEKYAHVTYFFNSQIEEASKGEDRLMIPSAKVVSFAEKPEMSAPEIAQAAVKKIETGKYDFMLINFANGDLVGHSGNFLAAKKAVETLDQALSKIVPAALENKYALVITADHGNCEYMTNPDGSQNPSHTLNPVRVVMVTKYNTIKTLKKKLGLSSIAPTVLKVMGMKKPKEMSGVTLF